MQFQSVTGMHDILPDEQRYFSAIRRSMRLRCRARGIKRISTPVLESTDLFRRAIGEATDIVEKEMYTFRDQGDHELTLRPELTAGIVRSYIQHGMNQLPQPVELYAIDAVFRHDRPQKGRFRQHFQCDVEVLGESDPAIDAEVIELAWAIMGDLGLAEHLEIRINSMGDPKDREKYIEQLTNFYSGKERSLCATCQRRLKTNPLRLLDCKEEDCKLLASMAPKLTDVMSEEAKLFHKQTKGYLDALGVPYVENPKLIRGQDYYTRTVFELVPTNPELAHLSVGGGGRYDGLVEYFGGPSTPASGFGLGMERMVMLMQEVGIGALDKDQIDLFVLQLGEGAKKTCMPLVRKLREEGLKVRSSFGKDSLKSQLNVANRLSAPLALIIGEIEVRDSKAILRDMVKGTQKIIPLPDLVEEVKKTVGK